MTDHQIKEQIEAIRTVTEELKASPKKAAAFLKAAGIISTPATKKNRKGSK